MALKMTFLGSGAAIVVAKNNFHSNVLLECNGDTLLIDAGTDLRIALDAMGYNHSMIRHVYITHQHFDHAGGLEWLALSTFFDSNYSGKPVLLADSAIIKSLTHHFPPGLCTLQDRCATLATYFDIQTLTRNKTWTWQGNLFQLVPVLHYYHDHDLMPSFGLFITTGTTRIFYTSDTQFDTDNLLPYYEKADVIFHDCETSLPPSGIHAHYQQLCFLPDQIKKKIWLYHYSAGELPDSLKDGFLGFVKRGQEFVF